MELTYRIAEAKKLSQLMNFTLPANGHHYAFDEPKKQPQQLINHARVLIRASLKSLPLRDLLGQSDAQVSSLNEGLQSAEFMSSLDIIIPGLSIPAIKPTPETSRALEAEARKQLLREVDEAVYARRNAAVKQKWHIKKTNSRQSSPSKIKSAKLASL